MTRASAPHAWIGVAAALQDEVDCRPMYAGPPFSASGAYRRDPEWGMEMVPIGVVGLCTRPTDGALLMAQHTSDPYQNGSTWAFVGGGVEAGELPEAAMRREWRDELVSDLSLLGLVAVCHRAEPDRTTVWYLFEGTCDWHQIRVDHQELKCFGWVTRRRLAILHAHRRLLSPRDYYFARYWLDGRPAGIDGG